MTVSGEGEDQTSMKKLMAAFAGLQIKVRGQRLEPSEVECVLMSQPELTAAHVTMAHHPITKQAQLIAYVTPASCDGGLLRDACMQQLPRHMVPGLFTAIPRLPQLPSGKVNMLELPPPDWSQQTTINPSEGPRSDLEAQVLNVMKDVLHSDAVGIHSDFFNMGGSSLLAHAVASGASAATGAAVQPAAVFQYTTAAGLAAHVAKLMQDPPPAAVAATDLIQAAPYTEAERRAGVPCSLNQEQMWLANDQLCTKHAYNVAMVWELLGCLDPMVLQKALRYLQARHEALRTSFCTAPEGRPLQCIQPDADAAPLLLSLSHAGPEDSHSAEDMLLNAAQLPFDLSRPPLMRVLLLSVSLTFPFSYR